MDKSPFNKLSAEIRNHIYELALAFDNPVCITDGSAIQPPRTRTSKQIRSESLLLFYSLNSFEGHIAADQIASSGSDVAYQKSINKITEWAENTPIECHDQVPALQLYFKSGKVWYINFIQGTWKTRKRRLRGLRDVLRRRGYEDDRVSMCL